MNETTDTTLRKDALARGMPAEAYLLVVNVDRQRMDLLHNDGVHASYPVSTSRHGVGEEEGSHCTPTGWHRVIERYGADAPLGTVFKHREPTGLVLPPNEWRGSSDEDLILSRILRLAGLEPGKNLGGQVDTFARYIYIHGTNHEERIGSPASVGCIRMKNADVQELFAMTADHEVWCFIS